VKLARDMVTREGPIQLLDLPHYFEGVWIHKRGDLYYASYPMRKDRRASKLVYSTCNSPLGPFEYKG
jgi:arabinoxylan arabinofuranohydrolase